MLVEIDADQAIPGALLEQIEMTIWNIEGFKNKESLQSFEVEDLEYDLALLPALKKVARHYSIPSEWSKIDEYQVHCDLVLDEYPELRYDFDEAYMAAGGDFESV